jgi:hypothetical protein
MVLSQEKLHLPPTRQILPLVRKIRWIGVPILPIIGKRQTETSLPPCGHPQACQRKSVC